MAFIKSIDTTHFKDIWNYREVENNAQSKTFGNLLLLFCILIFIEESQIN